VRMGLHTGPAEPVGDDYAVSHTLNRAARVTAAGYGGQVLLSQETAELVRRALPEGVTLKDLGEQRLKGLEQPERLYQVVVEGLPEDFPRLSTPVMRINNLPAQLTSFVGREKEIGEVSQQVRNNRLVTLTGVGGTGKTRLGLQVAERLLADFPNGVYLVELASLSDPQQVPQEVANAIGMLGSSDLSPEEQLVRYLRPRALLLVLDNCEHLVAACARLADRLLSGCPHLYILATSREGLGVRGEARYPLLPLPFPGSQPLPELDVLMGYAAVQLFVERAALARPGFNLTPQNASAVTRVCQRLDGLPLALELAAAWAYLLSVEQIAARLDDYFHLLVGGGRTLLPRHQTMRAALDWSYELLSEAERVLLRRLAVFAGGWTLEAAEAVCADPPGEPAATGVLASAAILALLSQLVSKSLVTALTTESKPQPEMRYRLLEPIRHYAAEVLEHSPDAGRSVRQRHGAFYLGWLAQRYPDLTGRRQVAAVHAINTEFENIRMAWDWAADQGRLELLLPAARTMCTFCSRDERVQVGEEICRVTAERLAPGTLSDPAASPGGVRLLILLWSTQAYLSGLLDDAPQAEQLLQQAADLLERAKATDLLLNWEEAFFLVQKGNTNWTQLRSAPAQACYEGALQLFHELGDRFWEAETLHVWSYLPNPLEDMRRLQESALVAYRSLGNPGGVAILLQEIGLTACRQGHFEESERLIHESLALCQENHDPFGIALSNFRLGEALLMMGRFAESQPLLAQSLVELEEHGSWMWARQCAAILSETEVHLGNYDRTRQLCQAALAEMHERHFLWGTQVGFRFLLSMACLGDRQPAEAQEWLAKALEQGWPLVSVEDVEIYLHDWMNDRRYRGWYLSLMGTADLQLGQVERAGQHLHAALKIWEQCGDNYVLYFCLPAIALLLAERGETRRAGEVYALARRFNHVVNSRWCSAVYGQPLAVHIGLPEEAFTTDAQFDLNRVVRAMLGESGLFSGYPAQTGQDLFYYS
jgi:predicted ATPase/tetratricopeptide (TPR) repeat protein